jgi:hypothetical protein
MLGVGVAANGVIRGREKYAGLPSMLLCDKTVPAGEAYLHTCRSTAKPIYEIYVNSRGERFVMDARMIFL